VPELDELLRFLVSGIAFGAVYAVSGTGLVVLYRTTGVLNFAFGAIGSMGVHLAWSIGKDGNGIFGFKTNNRWVTYLVCVAFCTALTYLYGRYIAPAFAQRDSLTRALGTLSLLLIVLGIMFWRWRTQDARRLELPMKAWKFTIGKNVVNGTQVSAVIFGILVTAGVALFLNRTALGTAMRAVANDRDVAALLGVPVRKVEAVAWMANGAICGVVGLFLAEMFRLDAAGLTFFIIPAIAAAVVGRLLNLWTTFIAGFVIGIVEAELTGFDYKWITDHRTMAPFVIAIGALLWFGRRRTIVLSGRAMQ
jgi:branched-chain amino acid transport system permease protein